MSYPPGPQPPYQPPTPPPQPSGSGFRPWHLLVGLIAAAVIGAGVLSFTLAAGSTDVRADMDARWDEMDSEDRIEICAFREVSEDLTVTAVVEAFEERASQRGEDITVDRDTAAEFVADKCG